MDAPFFAALSKNLCPSNILPLKAKKIFPFFSVLVSMDAPDMDSFVSFVPNSLLISETLM